MCCVLRRMFEWRVSLPFFCWFLAMSLVGNGLILPRWLCAILRVSVLVVGGFEFRVALDAGRWMTRRLAM